MSSTLKTPLQPVDLEVIRPVAAAARLDAVRCRELSARLLGDGTEADYPLTPAVSCKTDHRIEQEGAQLTVLVHVELRGSRSEADDSVDIVHVSAIFELAYTINGAPELPPEAVDRFADVNGLYNAWPYAREALQASTARLGLAPFTLELLRIPVKPKHKAE